MKGKRVFVGMSGGVDSSVSAALLRDQGYDVTGVFIKVWQPEGFPCSQTEDRQDAMRVAAKLGIPFITLDLSAQYKKEVIDEMVAGYAKGETPNPDILCNQKIKFGAFFKEAMARGADFVATGHYARVIEREGNFQLHTGVDESKDQSYFLWTLTQTELSRTLFPVGGLRKADVRKIATDLALPTAAKKDSQGLCFLGSIDVKEFLSRELGVSEGSVVDGEGRVVGTHRGAQLFTLGERHGFTTAADSAQRAPLYIIHKDIGSNTLTVAPAATVSAQARMKRVNWINGPLTEGTYSARFRYRQPLLPFELTKRRNGEFEVASVSPLTHQLPSGQSVVFYDGSRCLGGGFLA